MYIYIHNAERRLGMLTHRIELEQCSATMLCNAYASTARGELTDQDGYGWLRLLLVPRQHIQCHVDQFGCFFLNLKSAASVVNPRNINSNVWYLFALFDISPPHFL